MSPGLGIDAAGAPQAWRHAYASACDRVVDLVACGDEIERLSDVDFEICPPPTFERTIGSILGDDRGSAAVDGEPSRGRRRPVDPPPQPISPVPRRESYHRATAPPRPATHPASTPTRTTDVTSATPDRSQPAIPRPTDLPQRCSATRLRIAAGDATPEPLDGPHPVSPSDRSTAAARLDVPSGSSVSRAAARAADVLGISTSDGVSALVSAPVAPGPAATIDELRVLAFGRAVGERGPAPDGRPDAHERARAERTPLEHRRDRERVDGQPTTPARPSAASDVTRPDDDPGPARIDTTPGTGTTARRGEQIVREVTTHQELPSIPDRDRSSAPTPEPHRATDGATSIDQPPGHAAITTHDDLERRMKQILDEAARRHGIEV